MATIKPLYGSNGQGITVTLASLSSASARASATIDNTTNLFDDVLVQLIIKSGASGVTSTGVVNVYAAGSVDGGTTFAENATGSDAGITLTVPPNAKLIGQINMVATAHTYYSEPFSVASAFNGVLPQKFVIIVENQSGGAFDATEANHTKQYQGVQYQSV